MEGFDGRVGGKKKPRGRRERKGRDMRRKGRRRWKLVHRIQKVAVRYRPSAAPGKWSHGCKLVTADI